MLGDGVSEALGEGEGVGVAVGVGVGPTTPSPANSTCCGFFFAESMNVRPLLFFTSPAPIGSKTTSTSQDLPASKAPVHPLLCIAKGDDATMLVKVIEADLDLLVAVTISGALCSVAVTLPKSCLSGLSFSMAEKNAP